MIRMLHYLGLRVDDDACEAMDGLVDDLLQQGDWASVTLARLGTEPSTLVGQLDRFTVDHATVVHIETHGDHKPGEWAFSGKEGSLAASDLSRRRKRVAPGLLVVGACHAGTPEGRRTLLRLFAPGTPLLATTELGFAPQVKRLIAPVIDAAHQGRSTTRALRDAQAKHPAWRTDAAWALSVL